MPSKCPVTQFQSLSYWSAALIALSALAGCVAPSGYAEPARIERYSNSAQPWLSPGSADDLSAARDKDSTQKPLLLASADKEIRDVPLERRVVIYSAAFRLVVADVPEAIKSTESIADRLGGYVQKIDGDAIIIRVPVARYSDATKQVSELGQVTNRQLDAVDVTEDYVDLEARLKNALAVRGRLEALLEKATDVKAAIEVEKELSRVGEEIEQLQAKLELIRNRVAFTTISATFERVARLATGPAPVARLPFAWLRNLSPSRLLWQSGGD